MASVALAATVWVGVCRAAMPTSDQTAGGGAAAAPSAKESRVEMLSAGPVHLKFQDGELRYLYVGNKEIVRRVYFAVRDANWQTPMPVFSKIDIEKKADSFRIALAATCKSDTVDYAWTGEIVGTADGQITFSVTGVPQKTFLSNRIGLCVLYGADSLVGQTFETLGADGKTVAGQFPELVKMDLVAKDYKSLKYTVADGMTVTCSLSPILFTMEDQRNYGDSSFKAYNTVLAGQDAVSGEKATVTATLKVTGAKAAAPAAGPVRVIVGKELPGVMTPRIDLAKESTGSGNFLSLGGKRDQFKDQAEITFGYAPSTHLPDDDTFMENRTGILWQLKTLHTLAPQAKLHVDPIRLTGNPDPRSTGLFAASWAVGAIKYLALGGAAEACFTIDIGPLAEMAHSNKGLPLLTSEVICNGRPPVEVLATLLGTPSGDRRIVMVANSTNETQKVVVEGLPAGAKGRTLHYAGAPQPASEDITIGAGGVMLEIGPYAIGIVTVESQN
jgi:hypothetical protein